MPPSADKNHNVFKGQESVLFLIKKNATILKIIIALQYGGCNVYQYYVYNNHTTKTGGDELNYIRRFLPFLHDVVKYQGLP